jgi:hypothetical protein
LDHDRIEPNQIMIRKAVAKMPLRPQMTSKWGDKPANFRSDFP